MEQIDTIKAERDTMEQDLKVQQDDMGQYYMLTIIKQWHEIQTTVSLTGGSLVRL